MSCKECEARSRMAREALLQAKFKEAAIQLAKGAVELVGLKEKTAAAELESEAEVKKAVRPFKRKENSK